jgi:outer membrane lipoprotein-sorting protein
MVLPYYHRSARGWLRRLLSASVAGALSLLALNSLAQSDALLDQWIAAQTNLHTWSADVIQTRSLKTLSQPLVSTGKVWVAVPDQFRWELGQPAQTIALRQPDHLFLIYPKLKRIEKYPLKVRQPGPAQDALALLEASFPRNRAELDAHFRLVTITQTNGTADLVLQPKSATARKFMSEILISFHTDNFSPAATELKFSDGSSMRNDFTNGVSNPTLPEGIFEVKPEPGFTLVEPLGQ